MCEIMELLSAQFSYAMANGYGQPLNVIWNVNVKIGNFLRREPEYLKFY